MSDKSLEAPDTTSATLFDKLKWMTSKEAAHYLRVSAGRVRESPQFGPPSPQKRA